MVCKNCKNQIDNNAEFCPHCGAKTKKSHVAAWIIAIFVLFILMIVGFIAAIFIFVFSLLGKAADSQYVELDEYKVPNMFYKSDYKLCNYSYSNTNIEMKPCNNFSDDAVDEYIDELKSYGFVVENTGSKTTLIKELNDGREIVVEVKNDKIKYTLE